MAVKAYLQQDKRNGSATYGRYYAYADNERPISIDDLARHMSEHNTPYSKGCIKGILTDMVSCIRELNLNGVPVKLDNLAIFSAHIENKGGFRTLADVSMAMGQTDEQGKPVGISSLRLCAQATGDFTRAELTKYGTVILNREWRQRVQDAKAGAVPTDSQSTGTTTGDNSGSTGGNSGGNGDNGGGLDMG